MEEEMFAFFPNGIRALLVDDDPKFLKSATMMLSLFHFKVATCSSPSSALRLLSSDGLKDIDVVLADAHRVAACGFDLRAIVEPDLRIPVIYFMALESPTPAASDETSDLARTVQSATFIIKKPLDVNEVTRLWRVTAWRKCVLDARRVNDRGGHGNGNNAAPAFTGVLGDNLLPLLAGAAVDVDDREVEHVHYKVVRAGGRRDKQGNNRGGASSSETRKHRVIWTPGLMQKFERAVKEIGIGGHPSKILEHMNVKGLGRHHVASHLQKYRGKLQKKNGGCGVCTRTPGPDTHPPKKSMFVDAVLPRLNIQQYNIAAAAFTGGNYAPTLPPWPLLLQQLAGNNAFDNITPTAMSAVEQESFVTEASNVTATSFTGNAAPVLPFWPLVFQQPTGNVRSNIAPAVMRAEEQQYSGAGRSNIASRALDCNAAPALPPWPQLFQQPNEKNIFDNIALAAMSAEEHQYFGAGPDIFPWLFLGPFAYQGPSPPLASQTMSTSQGEVEPQCEVEVQPPFEQSGMGDLVVGAATGAAAAGTHLGALENSVGSLMVSLNPGAGTKRGSNVGVVQYH